MLVAGDVLGDLRTGLFGWPVLPKTRPHGLAMLSMVPSESFGWCSELSNRVMEGLRVLGHEWSGIRMGEIGQADQAAICGFGLWK